MNTVFSILSEKAGSGQGSAFFFLQKSEKIMGRHSCFFRGDKRDEWTKILISTFCLFFIKTGSAKTCREEVFRERNLSADLGEKAMRKKTFNPGEMPILLMVRH